MAEPADRRPSRLALTKKTSAKAPVDDHEIANGLQQLNHSGLGASVTLAGVAPVPQPVAGASPVGQSPAEHAVDKQQPKQQAVATGAKQVLGEKTPEALPVVPLPADCSTLQAAAGAVPMQGPSAGYPVFLILIQMTTLRRQMRS